MFRRWMDNVGRFDKDVSDYVKTNQKGLESGGTPMPNVEESFDLAEMEEQNNSDIQSCFFVKSKEQVDAIPGDMAPFYAKINGRNIRYKDCGKMGGS